MVDGGGSCRLMIKRASESWSMPLKSGVIMIFKNLWSEPRPRLLPLPSNFFFIEILVSEKSGGVEVCTCAEIFWPKAEKSVFAFLAR